MSACANCAPIRGRFTALIDSTFCLHRIKCVIREQPPLYHEYKEKQKDSINSTGLLNPGIPVG